MVKRRAYRLGRRADQAAATRRRILDATLSLHDEQGISATSVRDVATRAGVSPGTVLNHFPRMDDLIQACGQLSDQLAPMPTASVFASATHRRERIRKLAEALFAWYELVGAGWEHLQVDRRTQPQVDAWLSEVDASHRGLVAAALGDAIGSPAVALGTALTSFGSWQSLDRAGLSSRRSAGHVAQLLDAAQPEPSTPPSSEGSVH